ncbi:septum formation family protein [Plantactinospora sp. KBS50]|uniref:septum formation family protein n=1 Tax=Plantactinospora sp. KBS50 TaxID=2024580 RepID=UPI0012FD9561|nr:septum formation family protein [Plantactinospora sp. KBS50]
MGRATALALAVAVTLGACNRPTGLDADLTDDWAPVGRPTVWTPASGTCHVRAGETSVATYQPIGCDQEHRAETVRVAAFTGAVAEAPAPPAAGSAAVLAAHDACDRDAARLLGADWRTGRLVLTLILPKAAAWGVGARWYRCDLSETRSLDDDTAVARTSSLRGALTGAAPLAHRCFQPKMINNDINFMDPVGCDQPHRAEFVGVYRATEATFEAFRRNDTGTHRACMSLVARFAGIPDDDVIGVRVGSIYYHPDATAWAGGDRGVQCFLWMNDRDLTRSAKGGGPSLLPVS